MSQPNQFWLTAPEALKLLRTLDLVTESQVQEVRSLLTSREPVHLEKDHHLAPVLQMVWLAQLRPASQMIH